MKLSLGVVVFASLLGAALVGCASNDPESPASGQPTSSEDDLRGTCAAPRRYMAVVREAECTEVAANRGRWVPSPLFPDAPPGSGACFYTWQGQKSAPVDRAALAEHVGFFGALVPSPCGSEALGDAVADPAPDFNPGTMVGAVGCDVCGMQKDGKIWIVIPPDKVNFRVVTVPLSNGTDRYFRIAGAGAARAATLSLPPPPAGAQYVNGRIAVQ